MLSASTWAAPGFACCFTGGHRPPGAAERVAAHGRISPTFLADGVAAPALAPPRGLPRSSWPRRDRGPRQSAGAWRRRLSPLCRARARHPRRAGRGAGRARRTSPACSSSPAPAPSWSVTTAAGAGNAPAASARSWATRARVSGSAASGCARPRARRLRGGPDPGARGQSGRRDRRPRADGLARARRGDAARDASSARASGISPPAPPTSRGACACRLPWP